MNTFALKIASVGRIDYSLPSTALQIFSSFGEEYSRKLRSFDSYDAVTLTKSLLFKYIWIKAH